MSIFEEARREGVRSYGVSGIITRDGKVLLTRRLEDDFLGGIYEFPGGAVEEGEGLADALIREVREETGLTVSRIGGMLGFSTTTPRVGRGEGCSTFWSTCVIL